MKTFLLFLSISGSGMLMFCQTDGGARKSREEYTIPAQDGRQSGMEIKVIKTMEGLPYSVDACPNATNDLLLITLTGTEAENFRYVLYNKNGKMLEQDELTSKVSAINMKNHPAGLYLLKVMKQDQEIKTFEIVKH